MKKFKYFIVLLIAVVMAGCVSLDEKPMTFITPDQFFKTEADANAACLGMYPDMYSITETWTNIPRGVEANLSDLRMLAYNVLEPQATDAGHMTKLWASLYSLVRKTNTVISGLESSPLEVTKKNQYLGEAKAMRAYAYLRLAKNWGDVPMSLTTFSSGSSRPVTPMKDIFTQIFKDLNEALYVTPVFASGSKPGRLDKAGTRMILADAAVTIAQAATSYKNGGTNAAALKPYADAYGNEIVKYFMIAKNQLDTVIKKETAYKLYDGKNGASWISMFGRTADGNDRVNNCESILRTQSIPSLYTGGQVTVPGLSNYFPATGSNNLYPPTYEYINSFDKNDLRRRDGFVWFYQNLNVATNITEYRIPIRQYGNEPFDLMGVPGVTATNGFADYPNANNGETYLTRTLVEIVTGSGANVQYKRVIQDASYYAPACAKFFDQATKTGSPAITTPLYRMAEAYLMFAEASVNLDGINQEAIDKLNAIHTRAFTDKAANTYTLGNFTNLSAFNNALVDEYIWEFGFENKIPLMLIRFGKLQERINKVTSKSIPQFSATYKGSIFGVEAESNGEYGTRQRKNRGVDQYWTPYPVSGEIELNDAMKGLVRMKY